MSKCPTCGCKCSTATNSSPAEILLQFDGGARGNPGRAGAGAVIYDSSGREIWRKAESLGFRTNNQAEYSAVIMGLEYITSTLINSVKILKIEGDSQLIVRQLSGQYQVKSVNLINLYKEAKSFYDTLIEHGIKIEINHIPREQNSVADGLANTAMNQTTNGSVI